MVQTTGEGTGGGCFCGALLVTVGEENVLTHDHDQVLAVALSEWVLSSYHLLCLYGTTG